MRAYSVDLREKIIASYEEGGTSIRKLAERFKVSKGMVANLIKLKKTTGNIHPKPATGGKLSQLAQQEEELAQMVRQCPDYTLEEYCEYWDEQTGVRVSASTMCRALQKHNGTLKKKHSGVAKLKRQTNRSKEWNIGPRLRK